MNYEAIGYWSVHIIGITGLLALLLIVLYPVVTGLAAWADKLPKFRIRMKEPLKFSPIQYRLRYFGFVYRRWLIGFVLFDEPEAAERG